MSGGSHNYLCYKDAGELLSGNYHEDLRRMADDLAALDYAQDAARETEELICMLNQARVRIEVRMERLYDVWHGLEWWHSCDSSEETFKQVLATYRGEDQP